MWLKEAMAELVEALAPRRCPGCDLPWEQLGMCPACAPLLDPAPIELRPPAEQAALHLFEGPLADAIRRLKYGRRDDVAAGLAELVAVGVTRYSGLVDAVVPIPLHGTRLMERGFNQSTLLAAPAARRLGVPLRLSWLRRVRGTVSQVTLDREGRLANVRGAFRADAAARGRRVLLVDDVRTTGATFRAAAEALRAVGASRVYALALAAAEAGRDHSTARAA